MSTPGAQPRARRLVGLALACVIVASGCGSDPESGDEASPTPSATASEAEAGTTPEEETKGDPCDLVSDDVAADVLGVKIVRREPHEKEGSTTCIKGTKRSDDMDSNSFVNVNVFSGQGAKQLANQADVEEGSKQVSGLGDRAFFLPNAGALFVVDGDEVVNVQVVKQGKPSSQGDAVTVARDVLSRR
jgi:hypothetical protein